MAIEEHQRRLGERLRDIRHQQGMTLQDVETTSGGRWKAVVVGSYERGDRAIPAAKLIELAGFYGVPVTALLPDGATTPEDGRGVGGLRLDLAALAAADGPRHRVLRRYVRDIQARRGDFKGRVISLRQDDLRMLATALEVNAEALVDALADEGLLVGAPPGGDPDRLEVLIRIDGQEAGREVQVDPVDGTLRLLGVDTP